MQIIPKNASSIATPSNAKVEQHMSPRDKAIAAFLDKSSAAPVAEALPVRDATRVSPEETSVVRPSDASRIQQKDTSETSAQEVSAEATKSIVEESKDQEDKQPLSSQYAILARKEKALRAKMAAQEASFKAKEAELRAKEEALKAKEVEYSSKYIPKDKLAQDPFSVLNELGLTYDQLTNLALSAPKAEEVAQNQMYKQLLDEIKSLKAAQEDSKKSFEEREQKNYEQAVNQLRNEAKSLVESDPSFETIKTTGSVEEVIDLIKRTFDEDGVLMSVEEAAKLVEDEISERLYNYASKINKIKTKLTPAQAAALKQEEIKQESPKTVKTLTNSITSSKPLSARERAILAFQRKLNQ